MYVACRMLLVARVFRVPSLWDMRHNNITFKGSEKRQEGVKKGQELPALTGMTNMLARKLHCTEKSILREIYHYHFQIFVCH